MEKTQYITEGTYYLGWSTGGAKDETYKTAICDTSIEGNLKKTTKDCVKTSNTWTGLVGLPRIGEMFSTHLANKQNGEKANNMWIITPQSILGIRYNYNGGSLGNRGTTDASGARPSIYLKSNVIITSGDGMSKLTPYTIGLSN